MATPSDTIQPGCIVIVHLVNPTEKMWGVLQGLGVHGIDLRGINVTSFDEWMAEASRRDDEPRSLGLTTVFVPLFRVEKLFLDEPVGSVESYQQRFFRRVGMTVERYLGLTDTGELETALPS